MKTMPVSMPGVLRLASAVTALALVALPVFCQLDAQEPGTVVSGRLVLERPAKPSDWRILVGQHLLAELPRDAAGRPLGTTPKANGTFALQAVGPGWMYVCPYVGGRLAVDAIIPLKLTPGQASPQKVTLAPKPPRARVAFTLRREDGTPPGRTIKVHLYNVYGEVDASAGGAWSDEAGVVPFEQLPCGRYDLWIEGPAQTGPPDGEALSAAVFAGLKVTAGNDTQAINLTIPRPGVVQGRLLLADGKTPAEKHVVAVQSATVPDEETGADQWAPAYARGAHACYAQTEVAADGTFVLKGLAPGQHLLDIRRPGQREAWCTIPGAKVTAGAVTDLGAVAVARNGWQCLFDRKTLAGWVESDFFGRSEVRLENDRIVLPMGNDMTGITWTQETPRLDYEVSLEAMRVAGSDFFCGLTFPVQEDYCSLILGGWGGSVVGLSSLDGQDASENETSQWVQFEDQRWYRVRLRVARSKIEAWLDSKQLVNVNLEGRSISTRLEVEPSKPFGISTWRTTGAVRDIRIRSLDAGQ